MRNKSKEPEKAPIQPTKHSSRKKWVIIAGIVVILLIAAAVIAWTLISLREASTVSTTSTTRTTKQSSKSIRIVTQASNSAQKIIVTGGSVDAAAAVYKEAITATDDTQTKSSLYMSEAVMYFNDGNYDKALETAKKSEEADLNENVEQFIARIYEIKKDNQNAIKYYQQAISLIDKSQPLATDYAEYYQGKIDALKGLED